MGKLIFNSPERGSLLVSMAIIMPIFILLIGFIVDIGRALVIKDNLNQACMVAAEEAVKCIDINKASEDGIVILSDNYEEIAIKYFKDNLKENNFLDIVYIGCEVSDSIDNPKYITVSSRAKMRCHFLKMVNINTIEINSFANGRIRRIK